jgi:hypothetical protein
MMATGTLVDLIDRVADVDDSLTIYALAARVFSPNAPAVLCYSPEWPEEYEDNKGYPPDTTHLMAEAEAEAAGWRYVLEVPLARTLSRSGRSGARDGSRHRWTSMQQSSTTPRMMRICLSLPSNRLLLGLWRRCTHKGKGTVSRADLRAVARNCVG